MFPFGKIISGIPWSDAKPITITGATGNAITITTSGKFAMGTQGSGLPVTTAAPHLMQVHTLPVVDLDSGTSTFGIRSRYEVNTNQTNNITIHAVDGRFRPKANLATGIFAGVCGYLEGDGTFTFAGSADSLMCAGLFTVELDTSVTLTTGRVIGVGIDSAVNGSLDVSNATYTGLRIWTGSSKEPWTYGISIDDCVTGLLIENSASVMTTGISITGATTNGINITGASSTAQINLAHTMAAYGDQCILVVSSSSATDGSSQAPIKSSHTMTGAGATGGRAEFNCTFQPGASGAAGGWTNALKANFTFGSNATGGVGLHTALTAEMSVPNATVSGGEFACLDMQLGLPASHVPQAKGLSFFTMNSYTTPATMDTYGTLFALYGVTGADNKMFDDSVSLNNAQVEGMLRIRILGNYWYIPLCDDPDGAA